MLDSMKCEPYGCIKPEHDDLYNVRINEVEGVKTNYRCEYCIKTLIRYQFKVFTN